MTLVSDVPSLERTPGQETRDIRDTDEQTREMTDERNTGHLRGMKHARGFLFAMNQSTEHEMRTMT